MNEAKETTTAVQKREPQKVSVIGALAGKLECDPAKLVPILKKTVFSNCRNDEEFQTMCMVANTYGLNPLLKELYAFPNKKNGAIIPIVSVDGWNKIMNSHPQYDGIEFEEGMSDGDKYCTAIIYRKDKAHPTKVTEWESECKGGTEPWTRWPRRMLRHKALIQCARIAFGFAGIYDEDEGQRIREAEAANDIQEKRASRVTASDLLMSKTPKAEPPADESNETADQAGNAEAEVAPEEIEAELI